MFYLNMLILLLLISCQNKGHTHSETHVARLDSLFDSMNFYQFREEHKQYENTLNSDFKTYYKAIQLSLDLKPSLSNGFINDLFKNNENTLNEKHQYKLEEIRLNNYIRLFDYKQAAATIKTIQNNYAAFIDSTQQDDFANSYKLWHSIADIPKQTVRKKMSSEIMLSKDKAGLLNLDVMISDSVDQFIFDTGANISVLRKSLADKYKLTKIATEFTVDDAIGNKVNASLVVADSIEFGQVVLHNVVFLLIDDNTLTFPQISYQINGIIGYPIIHALNEIHINLQKNQLTIPVTEENYTLNNFVSFESHPIIHVSFQKKRTSFFFDSGAGQTTLHSVFYNKFKSFLDPFVEKKDFSRTGVGGTSNFQGLSLPTIELSLDSHSVTIQNLKIHLTELDGIEQKLDGVLGRDWIKNSNKTLVLSFKHSSAFFKEPN